MIMTWTDPSTFLNEIDNPIRSIDGKADAANIEAQANGDAGAPKQQELSLSAAVIVKLDAGANGALLNNPVSGTAFLNKNLGGYNPSGIGATYPERVGNFFDANMAEVLGCALNDGSITVRVNSVLSGITTANLIIKVYRNNVEESSVVYTTTHTSTDFDTVVNITKGDSVYITSEMTVLTGAGGLAINASALTSNDVIGVI